jgi:NodT family efflux transporter outer membrane factor (OMF) lipoprotein
MMTVLRSCRHRRRASSKSSRLSTADRCSGPLCTHAVVALTVIALLGGCAITRVDPPPPVAAPAEYKEAGTWLRAADAAPVPDDWWRLFNDPVLDDLQRRLVIGNENLKQSVAAVASARAAYDASRSAFFPTLSAGLSATRSGSPSTSSGNLVANNNGNFQNPSNSVSLSATASWEVDLWGRLSQASSAAQASYQASADDLASARLSAQALLAQTYFSLRAADAQAALLERSVQGYRRSLDLTQDRYQGGVAARTDVLQAQTQLKSAQAQLADTNASRAQLEHAIAVLLGQPPSTFAIARGVPLATPPAVPRSLPSALLQRRPDIAAAERRVSAAYAQIGVADAAFFPALTLSATAGFRNSTLA